MRTLTRLHLLLAVAVLSLSGPPALAAQRSGALLVSATVRPSVRLAFDAPPVITIAEEDLSRGYVDLTEDAVLSFQTNSPSGFVVVGAISDPAFTRADVSGLGGELQITAAGGFSVLPFTGTSRETRKLAVRLFLANGTAPGERAFPVRLSARLVRASSVLTVTDF